MVNLFKSHITALTKVYSALGGWTISMGGLAINSVMTPDDSKKMMKAREHIEKAIDILKTCNQMR